MAAVIGMRGSVEGSAGDWLCPGRTTGPDILYPSPACGLARRGRTIRLGSVRCSAHDNASHRVTLEYLWLFFRRSSRMRL